MQNKANFLDALMNVTSLITVDYENIANWKLGENKANTKPIKANLLDAQMNVSSVITKDYRKNDAFAVQKNKPNTNPNKAKFRTLFPLTARPVRRNTLSSNGAGDYNEISSRLSICRERQMKGFGNE